MKIPVCHLSRYGSVYGTVYYQDGHFIDENNITERDLPVQDYMSCTVVGGRKCTVIGKVYSRNNYVACFGDNFAYELTKDELLKYSISNMYLRKNGSLVCMDGKLPDMGFLFPVYIKYVQDWNSIRASSLGVLRKFLAKFRGKYYVAKWGSSESLKNEILYKKVADIMDVPCCECLSMRYFGQACVLSKIEYNFDRDVFTSFKAVGKPVNQIYLSMSPSDRRVFDRMMLLDYLMSQEDRHLANLALCNGKMYPLYDNGECLGNGIIDHYSRSFRKYVEGLNYGKVAINYREVEKVLGNKYPIFEANARHRRLL